jgi:membrane fusion protein (multidrug efflux system)
MAEPARNLEADPPQESTPPTGEEARGRPRGAPPRLPAKRPEPPRRNRRRILIVAGVIAAVVLAGAIYWYSTRNLETTDDAFVDGNAVQLAPRIAGTVVTLAIDDNQFVHKGDLLVALDPRDYEVAVENARAALANATAQAAVAQANLALTQASTAATLEQARSGVEYAKAAVSESNAQVVAAQAEAVRAREDAARYQQLVKVDAASRQRFEQAQAATRSADAQLRAAQDAVAVASAQVGQAQGKLDEAKTAPQQVEVRQAELAAAEAQVAAARAALDQAELNLSYTRIVAPEDGVITKRSVNPGDQVQKDQNLAALVFGKPWVTANFKETQLTRMRPGQPVSIVVDAYPGHRLEGHVDSIQRGTGAHFALLPPENATGNYVKVVQRVPVKIDIDGPLDPAHPLGLGMSVEPAVDVGADPSRHGQR